MSLTIVKPYGGILATGSINDGPNLEIVYNLNQRTGQTVMYQRLKRTVTNFTASQIDTHNLTALGASLVRVVNSIAVLKSRKTEFISELLNVPVLLTKEGQYVAEYSKMLNKKGEPYNANQWPTWVTGMFMRKDYIDFITSETEWATLTQAEKDTWTSYASFSGKNPFTLIFKRYKAGGLNVPIMESEGHILFTIGHWHENFTINNPRIVGHGTSPNATNAQSWRDYLAE